MRLIDAQTLKLKEFVESETPPYAILSHTWGSKEITFRAMQAGPDRNKEGFKKIAGCCHQAVKDGYYYVWVDTCCINKSSSAELSEAINSMFRWYAAAKVCYVFLSNLDIVEYVTNMRSGVRVTRSDIRNDIDINELPLEKCRWFTRGWTLQELIAPSRVDFFDRNWKFVVSKRSFLEPLSSITGVDEKALEGVPLRTFSIAKRMSWASNRQTTRAEDIAYCLLGIFDVNMPLLYGEGTKAFIRL